MWSVIRFSLALGLVGGIFGDVPEANAQASSSPSDNSDLSYSSTKKVPESVWERAKQGDALSQSVIGMRYLYGDGVPQDYTLAFNWFQKAADQGRDGAQFSLGFMYVKGLGVAKNYTSARIWFQMSADQGNRFAQAALGELHAQGHGVPQDYVEAHKWFNLSASQGFEAATEKRNEIAVRMTPAQIAEAQKLAREWRKKEE